MLLMSPMMCNTWICKSSYALLHNGSARGFMQGYRTRYDIIDHRHIRINFYAFLKRPIKPVEGLAQIHH